MSGALLTTEYLEQVKAAFMAASFSDAPLIVVKDFLPVEQLESPDRTVVFSDWSDSIPFVGFRPVLGPASPDGEGSP